MFMNTYIHVRYIEELKINAQHIVKNMEDYKMRIAFKDCSCCMDYSPWFVKSNAFLVHEHVKAYKKSKARLQEKYKCIGIRKAGLFL